MILLTLTYCLIITYGALSHDHNNKIALFQFDLLNKNDWDNYQITAINHNKSPRLIEQEQNPSTKTLNGKASTCKQIIPTMDDKLCVDWNNNDGFNLELHSSRRSLIGQYGRKTMEKCYTISAGTKLCGQINSANNLLNTYLVFDNNNNYNQQQNFGAKYAYNNYYDYNDDDYDDFYDDDDGDSDYYDDYDYMIEALQDYYDWNRYKKQRQFNAYSMNRNYYNYYDAMSGIDEMAKEVEKDVEKASDTAAKDKVTKEETENQTEEKTEKLQEKVKGDLGDGEDEKSEEGEKEEGEGQQHDPQDNEDQEANNDNVDQEEEDQLGEDEANGEEAENGENGEDQEVNPEQEG